MLQVNIIHSVKNYGEDVLQFVLSLLFSRKNKKCLPKTHCILGRLGEFPIGQLAFLKVITD